MNRKNQKKILKVESTTMDETYDSNRSYRCLVGGSLNGVYHSKHITTKEEKRLLMLQLCQDYFHNNHRFFVVQNMKQGCHIKRSNTIIDAI